MAAGVGELRRPKGWILLCTGAFSAVAFTGGASAQPVQVSDRVVCPDCSIESSVVSTLRPDWSVASFLQVPHPAVAKLTSGGFAAAPMAGGGRVGLFDEVGAFVRSIGREGQGPGEFYGPRMKMGLRPGAAGELHATQRDRWYIISNVSAEDVRVASTTMDVRADDMVPLGDDLLVQAVIFEPGGTTAPIQAVNRSGTAYRGVGVTRGRPISRGSEFDRYRVLAPTADGAAVWSGYLTRFEVSRFTPAGEEQVRIVRNATWFQPYDETLMGELFVVPQRPRIQSIAESSDGLLWIAVSRGDRNHEPVRIAGSGSEATVAADYDMNTLLDTVVEVIDVERGVVVARREFDRFASFVSTLDGSIQVYSLVLDGEDYVAEIVALSLTGYANR